MDIINAKKKRNREKQTSTQTSQANKAKEGPRKERKGVSQGPPYDGCIIVQVAASQLTSSKLCSMLNPIEERQSKLPSPST